MKELLILIGTTFFFANVLATGYGISSGQTKSCGPPYNRLEYVLPGFKLGCWLMEPLND